MSNLGHGMKDQTGSKARDRREKESVYHKDTALVQWIQVERLRIQQEYRR
jgi:hypothetical protein